MPSKTPVIDVLLSSYILSSLEFGNNRKATMYACLCLCVFSLATVEGCQ